MVNGGAAPPPRTLSLQHFVESRSVELGSLNAITANRLKDDFRSKRNKRRRTTGYDDRVARKRRAKGPKSGATVKRNDSGVEEKEDGKKVLTRRIRRRIELRKNPKAGYSASGDGTKRLRTHVWHAKRFTMTKLWGFHLPLCSQGRGRGSRALLKRLKHGVLIHDASYYSAVQLEGPEDILLLILDTILLPSPSALPQDTAASILSGATYGSAMLHHVGAPDSEPIAPVTYMWRTSIHQGHGKVDKPNKGECDQSQPTQCHSSLCQLWVWLHPSCFNKGFDILKSACQKQMEEAAVNVKCFSLEGQLAKLEVIGTKALQLIQKILHPVSCISSENPSILKRCSGGSAGVKFLKSLLLEGEDCHPSNSVISLTVQDPRSSPAKKSECVPAENIARPLNDLEAEPMRTDALSEIKGNLDNSPLVLATTSQSDITDLWESCNGISPPVEENVLSMEKCQRHIEYFCVSDKKSELLNSSMKEESSRLCPILLLKSNDQKHRLNRWSIVLPLSWTKAFWIPLITNGGHAIGLTEKHWVASEVQLPYFPMDFPDCDAYTCFMDSKAAATTEKLKLRPPAKRPYAVPIPPPWHELLFVFKRELTVNGGTFSHEERTCSEFSSNLSTSSDSRKHDKSLKGFVARKADRLAAYMNEVKCDDLLLFPMQSSRKTHMFNSMKNESRFCQGFDGLIQRMGGRRSCFLRVLLHACTKGAFEESAVVCAPEFGDITLLASRPVDDEGGLQMPASSLQSYFKEQLSGHWVTQIPEDPIDRKLHRWPIGYVTTGYVRGSKRPISSAICEALSLARLREEQWNDAPVKRRKKEIYVLVRNLRSTAYRLALATIILEEQEEDVELF